MEQKRLYDHAMFWVTAVAAPSGIGAIFLTEGKPLIGWLLVALGVVLFVVALVLYGRHFLAERRATADMKAGPAFEVINSKWLCEPPLSASPVQSPRDCTAQAVLRNLGAEGNGVLTVYYIGFGRAGNEYPEMNRRIVIPTTAAGAFVEVRLPVGSVPPRKLEPHPKLHVNPAAAVFTKKGPATRR